MIHSLIFIVNMFVLGIPTALFFIPWCWLTGDVGPLAARLGEIYWSDEGSIGHNSVTTIVGRTGRIAARIDGSQWRIDQVSNLIERELKETP